MSDKIKTCPVENCRAKGGPANCRYHAGVLLYYADKARALPLDKLINNSTEILELSDYGNKMIKWYKNNKKRANKKGEKVYDEDTPISSDEDVKKLYDAIQEILTNPDAYKKLTGAETSKPVMSNKEIEAIENDNNPQEESQEESQEEKQEETLQEEETPIVDTNIYYDIDTITPEMVEWLKTPTKKGEPLHYINFKTKRGKPCRIFYRPNKLYTPPFSIYSFSTGTYIDMTREIQKTFMPEQYQKNKERKQKEREEQKQLTWPTVVPGGVFLHSYGYDATFYDAWQVIERRGRTNVICKPLAKNFIEHTGYCSWKSEFIPNNFSSNKTRRFKLSGTNEHPYSNAGTYLTPEQFGKSYIVDEDDYH